MRVLLLATLTVTLQACARLEFHDKQQENALKFYEPDPYLLVAFTKDCTLSATVVVLPGLERWVSFKSGYGSANLTVGLSGGMIANVGQQTDTQIPQTITALSSLATAAAAFRTTPSSPAPKTCQPESRLYHIKDGRPDSTPAAEYTPSQ